MDCAQSSLYAGLQKKATSTLLCKQEFNSRILSTLRLIVFFLLFFFNLAPAIFQNKAPPAPLIVEMRSHCRNLKMSMRLWVMFEGWLSVWFEEKIEKSGKHILRA